LLKSKGKKEVSMKKEKVRWELLDVDVEVIEWSQREARDLIIDMSFQNQEVYEQYVVTHCVDKLKELMPAIDAFIEKLVGKYKVINEQDLNHELFLIACMVNPFLNLSIEGSALHAKKAG
jgi:hypothetical protein